MYLTAWLKDVSAVTHLTCAGDGACRVITPMAVLREVANAEQLEVLDRYERALLVDSNARAGWCPAPNCGRVALCSKRPPKAPQCAPS